MARRISECFRVYDGIIIAPGVHTHPVISGQQELAGFATFQIPVKPDSAGIGIEELFFFSLSF